jgi:hypothetical protein
MTDKTISVYWFFILFIIASAIVFLVYTLYGAPSDIREIESIFLSEKVADCVSHGGLLTSEGKKMIENGEAANILELCHLTFDSEKVYDWNDDQFFVLITFSELVNSKEPLIVYAGNYNLYTQKAECNLNGMIGDEKFPFCVERTIYSNSETENRGEYYSIQIFTSVKKMNKNA